jgi:uncharacterized protein YecT (DUF1311 family)
MKIILFLMLVSGVLFASTLDVQKEYENNKKELHTLYKKAYKVMQDIHYNGDKFELLHKTWYSYEDKNCHFLEKLLQEDDVYMKCMNKAMQERIQKYREWVDF